MSGDQDDDRERENREPDRGQGSGDPREDRKPGCGDQMMVGCLILVGGAILVVALLFGTCYFRGH